MSNDQDLIAAFLAKGNTVTVVREGESLGLTDRQWYRAVRDQPQRETYTREQRSEQYMEQVREAALMGGVAAVNEVLGYD
jgi:hypothetical protein